MSERNHAFWRVMILPTRTTLNLNLSDVIAFCVDSNYLPQSSGFPNLTIHLAATSCVLRISLQDDPSRQQDFYLLAISGGG